jgi:hypothetical protein
MNQYFYVYRTNDRGVYLPKVKHPTLDAVSKEATRLAQQHPGDSFEILAFIGVAQATGVTTTWVDGLNATYGKPAEVERLEEVDQGHSVLWGSKARPPVIAPAWEWPELPAGHSYLNPQSLSVLEVGIGYRPLCTLDESFPDDHEWRKSGEWTPGTPCMHSPIQCRPVLTFRTKAPIPAI